MMIRLRISKYKMLGRSLAREVGAALSLFNLLRYVTVCNSTVQFLVCFRHDYLGISLTEDK